MAPFYGWGSTASRLEPLWGGSLLFTTKSPDIPGPHFIDFGRMKGWVDLGATEWFWTRTLGLVLISWFWHCWWWTTWNSLDRLSGSREKSCDGNNFMVKQKAEKSRSTKKLQHLATESSTVNVITTCIWNWKHKRCLSCLIHRWNDWTCYR